MRPYRRARLGLARTFQSVELFDDLTVDENLLVASERAGVGPALRDLFLPQRAPDRTAVDWAIAVCDLGDVVERYPTEISLGRASSSASRGRWRSAATGAARRARRGPRHRREPGARPPAALAPREHGVTVLLVDHDMGLVLSVCDRLMVLDFGRRSPTARPRRSARTRA